MNEEWIDFVGIKQNLTFLKTTLLNGRDVGNIEMTVGATETLLDTDKCPRAALMDISWENKLGREG